MRSKEIAVEIADKLAEMDPWNLPGHIVDLLADYERAKAIEVTAGPVPPLPPDARCSRNCRRRPGHKGPHSHRPYKPKSTKLLRPLEDE